jgi:hypothetical protein
MAIIPFSVEIKKPKIKSSVYYLGLIEKLTNINAVAITTDRNTTIMSDRIAYVWRKF